MSFLLSLTFSLQQNWRRRQNRFCPKVGGEEVAQTIYTHVNKCKNNKIKGEKKKKFLPKKKKKHNTTAGFFVEMRFH
jgi:hypothetical protein